MPEQIDFTKDEIKFDILLDDARNCNMKNENNNLFVRGKQLCNFEKKGVNYY